MELLELKKIVFDLVLEYGADEAREILFKMLNDNLEMRLAAAKHGYAIVEAIVEARQSTIN